MSLALLVTKEEIKSGQSARTFDIDLSDFNEVEPSDFSFFDKGEVVFEFYFVAVQSV
jgi:hypothetical protein